MNLLTIIPLIIAAIPGIIQAIEIGTQAGVSGADKKAAALAAVTQAAAVAAEIDPGDATLINFCAKLAGPIIDALVALYNLKGIFKKKAAAAA